MSADIMNAIKISSMGMKAQGTRLRVISENIANTETTGKTPGADPYVRQTISFKNEMDRAEGVRLVDVDDIGQDRQTPFPVEFMPDHPAADEKGYVKKSNVNALVEIMDVREAQRSYEANLGMIEQARGMMMRTIDLLRSN